MTAAEFVVPDIRPGDRRSPLRWVLSHALRHKAVVLAMVAGALVNAALAAAIPMLVGSAYTIVTAKTPDARALGWVAAGVVLSQLFRAVWMFGRNFSSEVLGQRLERDMRAELYASLLGKSMTFHSLRPVGEIMARATNDVREVNLMFSTGLNLIIGSGSFLLMPLFVAPTIHPQLILTPLLFISGYALALWQYLHELNPVTERARENFGTLNAELEEAIEGIETVKGAAREPEALDRFTRAAGAYRDAYRRQGEIEARFVPLLLLALAVAGALLHALILYRDHLIGAGQVVSYTTLMFLFGFPTFISLFAFSQVSLGAAGARRILELVNAETELDHNPTGYAAPMRGEIRFETAAFGYNGDAPALQDVLFTVQPGQTVAIVGQTGAGKTTLVKLVNRTYDAAAGRVLVDGVDVRCWNLESLRQQISIIEQDLFLFSRTIAENIAFGKSGATQAEIEGAARAAQAHDFVASFRDGYQTVVGERGVTLSGGQRQRIALARAFLTNPRILILDDSTSAIDSATEDQIQKAIFRAAEGRTTLLITHRLSQIRWADQILVLRKGRVAAMGNHDELMASSDAYRRIFARYESSEGRRQ